MELGLSTRDIFNKTQCGMAHSCHFVDPRILWNVFCFLQGSAQEQNGSSPVLCRRLSGPPQPASLRWAVGPAVLRSPFKCLRSLLNLDPIKGHFKDLI